MRLWMSVLFRGLFLCLIKIVCFCFDDEIYEYRLRQTHSTQIRYLAHIPSPMRKMVFRFGDVLGCVGEFLREF